MSKMGLGQTTLRQEDPSEMNLETETGLPEIELLDHKPFMERKSVHKEQSKTEKDVSDFELADSPNTSDDSNSSLDFLYDDELDFLEVQKANNIMRAAYKEFMTIAVKANTWVFCPPVVGAVEELQEMFHTPPPNGFRVECSIESAILPISSRYLISMMMNAGRWASTFSHVVCYGSDDAVLAPLKKFWSTENTEVILVHAQCRLPAEWLPRWSTSFLRFKKMVTRNTWAIFDVSTDYFKDATSDPSNTVEYKRRPSGVIIRQRGLQSEVIWVENAEVQESDILKNAWSTSTSNFTLTAKHCIRILSQNLIRRHSKTVATGVFDETRDIPDLLTIAENLRRAYLETINPFPDERAWEIFRDDRIRISRDMRASCHGHQNDYIASSTIYMRVTPTRLYPTLVRNNVKFQWLSIKSLDELEMAAVCYTEDESNCITLRIKVETGVGKASKDHEFFLQEATQNEYCSFIVSSLLTEADVHISLIPRFCGNGVLLRPSGFAIMPAGPGGLQSEASRVTICIRRELENMEAEQAIEAMSSHMNAVINQISRIPIPKARDDENSQENTL